MKRDNRTNTRLRVGNLTIINTLTSCHCPMNTTLAVMLLMAASSLTTVFAFCPSEMRHQVVQKPSFNSRIPPFAGVASNRMGDRFGWMRSRHNYLSSVLFATNANENATDALNNEDSTDTSHVDDDDDDPEDIITQNLRRNAHNGPINPVKEHDKMMKENQEEALDNKTNTNSRDVSLVNSTFYKSLVASYLDLDLEVSHDDDYLDYQFKEFVSRRGEELEQLGPGFATLPLDPSSEEGKIEENLAQKELALQKVVDEIDSNGSGDWDREKIEEAQMLKSEIDRIHVDDCGAVLLANLAFYEAFSARDAEWMNDVWWNSPSVICVHPSHHPLIGSAAVLGSFKNIFSQEMVRDSRGGGKTPSKSLFMTPANIRGLSVRGTTASLVCDEEVHEKGDSEGYSGRFIVNKLLTTNVFRKVGGKWKMVHRHASWHPETLAAGAAMKAKPGFTPVKNEREMFNDNLRKKHRFSSDLEKRRMRLKKLRGEGTSKRPADFQPAPSSLDGINANAVMGVPDEEVKPKRKKRSSENDDLLRLLGIGSDSKKEEDDDRPKSGMSLEDLLSAGNESESTTTGSGTPDDPFITRKVIHIGPEQFNKLAADGSFAIGDEGNDDYEDGEWVVDEGHDDDDDAGDRNVVIDLRNESEEERKRILKSIFPDAANALMKLSRENDVKTLKSAALEPAPLIKPKDNKQSSTQKCITTIRKLSDQGLISSNQKRILLTDIIASSARGETSMVEVAYGLLLSDDNSAPGMEDFTEQCRVFASASMEENEFDE